MSDPRPQVVQALIQEIERVIEQVSPPWRLYQSWREQRQLLQRVRDVLSLWPPASPTNGASRREQSVDRIQANILAALQHDIQRLSQHRQQLQTEVDQLQSQLDVQRVQVMQPLIEQVEQLELFQQRADQTLQNLDRSLQLTFRTLDRDMGTYERALLQRLGHLDNLSQQGEAIVINLLQQVIREMQQLPSADTATAAPRPLPLDISPTAVEFAPTSAAVVPQTPPTPIATLGEIPGLLGLSETIGADQISDAGAATETDGADDPWMLPGLSDVFDAPNSSPDG